MSHPNVTRCDNFAVPLLAFQGTFIIAGNSVIVKNHEVIQTQVF